MDVHKQEADQSQLKGVELVAPVPVFWKYNVLPPGSVLVPLLLLESNTT